MGGTRRTQETFESSATALGGSVAQAICLLVVVGSVVAYVFSAEFRERVSFLSLAVGVVVWLGIAAGLRWLRRAAARAEREGPRPRHPMTPPPPL